MGLSGRIKSYFFRGLAVLMPSVLTVWILAVGYIFLKERVLVYINKGLVWLIYYIQGDNGIPLVSNDPNQTDLNQIFVEGPAGSAIGFILIIVLICIVGAFLASVVGHAIWRIFEGGIMSIPLLNKIYPNVKQVTDFVLARQGEKQKLFSKVVAVEYPRPGIWSLGLVTGEGLKPVIEKTGEEVLSVLIPNSPTPVTGYVIMVPRKLTIPLDISIEEAFRFTISAGVINPRKDWELDENIGGGGQLPKNQS